MSLSRTASIAASLALTSGLFAGCSPVPAQQGLLEESTVHAQLSSHQLRILVNDYVVHFASRVEATADQILAQTSDPAIRKNALLWKINGISAGFRAGTRPDPLGAYMDVWILNKQMLQLFESPDNRHLFGPSQYVAIEQCREFEERLRGIYAQIGADLPYGERFAAGFAAEFPVSSLYLDRESLSSRYIAKAREPSREMFHVVAGLQENLDELQKLSVTYAEYLPKQVRWEAELLLIDAAQIATVQRPLQDLSLATHSIAAMADTAGEVPQLLQREREALGAVAREERVASFVELERMRRETIGQLEKERDVVLASIGRERTAVLDSLREERVVVSEQLNDHVRQVLTETDDISQRRTEEIAQHGSRLVDQFFRRAWQLCAVFALLAAIFAGVLFRRRSGPPPARGLPTPNQSDDEGTVAVRLNADRAKAA